MRVSQGRKKSSINFFILNLAVTDFQFVLTLPFWAVDTALDFSWPFGDAMCKIILSITVMNMYASVFFLTAMSITRYWSVASALNNRSRRMSCSVKWISLLLWVSATVATAPTAIFSTVTNVAGEKLCLLKFPADQYWLALYHLQKIMVAFVIPMLILSICYLLLLRFIRQKGMNNNNPKRRSKVTKSVTIVVLSFFLCWAPNHAITFWGVLVKFNEVNWDKTYYMVHTYIFPVTVCLAHANSCLNPILYCLMRREFRKIWDEWVPESRVLKYVDTNLQKQKELQKANQDQYAEGKMRGAAPGKKIAAVQQKNVELKTKKNKQKTPGPGEGTSTSEMPQPPRKKRARVDPTVESEETFMNRVEVKVKIPEELKPWLVDDWDLITRQKQLFHLPAKKNVDTVLEDYANYKKSRGNSDNKEFAVNEVVAGIREYFNVMLGTQLLYKFERPQYAEILADHPDAPMSQIYGAPHLLRLFVRIGAMLAYTPLDEKSLALLLNYLQDFLKYLVKNASTLFSASDYEVAPPEYHRKAV
ncbi:MO4L1 protein, partial [Polyodon spathula]|nr:MO4L1 protein [Polyodon spathula]